MITFTLDSIESACTVLQQGSHLERNLIYINNGQELLRVIGIKEKQLSFECGGQSVSSTSGFSIQLENNITIEISIESEKYVIANLPQIDKFSEDFGITNNAAGFMF
ncbi:hypothetical protein [Parashewanella tropica]|uniref:hypothetical protein n=1 Tax=Parashewanella tropica TaxID=2547970 RepID=UPI0010599B3C|nr:hypothetical protein [Parashewanella tropica]